jgi:hypothetical protein
MLNPKTAVIVKALQTQKIVKEIVQKLRVPSKTVCGIKDQLKTRRTTERKNGSD